MSGLLVPIPSAGLLAVLERLAADPAPLVDDVIAQLHADIPEYQLAPPAVQRDVHDSVLLMHRLWYETLRSGQAPGLASLEAVAAAGRRRVHQGMPLDALLRAFRLGTRRIWDALLGAAGDDPELHRELLFAVSPYVFDHFDLMAQTIAQAFGAEQLQRLRWRDALAHELCSILFNRPDNEAGFRRNAEALGMDPSIAHCALALQLRQQSAPPEIEGEADRLVVRVARLLQLQRDTLLHTLHRGSLLVWLPLPRGESVIAGEQRLAGQAAELLAACPEVTTIGIGLPAVGARGWRASADQALRVLESGRASTPGAIGRYSEVALTDAVSASPGAAGYFEALVERLGQDPLLLETLETFFERRQHRKATAAALDIHPNTLNYRLERIEALLGAQLDDVGWIARLHTALRLRKGG